MLKLRSGAPPRCGALGVVPWLLLAATGVAGCASSQARSFEPPTRVSSSPPYVAGPRGAGVEMEDDGVPVQPPPVARRSTEPDDPSEPFSPNYGRAQSGTNDPPVAEPLPAPRREASLGESPAAPRRYFSISH